MVVFSSISNRSLEKMSHCIRKAYLLPTEILNPHADISEYFDNTRGQYDANRLLNMVKDTYALPDAKTIGLFNIDLFIPIFTYIFGQAHLGGDAAIVSQYRLRNERLGIAPDAFLHRKRFCKEIIHELGHTFGLKHCHTPNCVMRSSTYTEDVDQKTTELCPKCRSEYELLTGTA